MYALIIAIVVILIIFYYYRAQSPKEGFMKNYVPFTQSDLTCKGAPLFYHPRSICTTYKLGDFNFMS